MANTPAGNVLTMTYHRQQLGLRAAALRDVVQVWPSWDFEDLDGTWPRFQVAALAIMERYHRLAGDRARGYYSSFRAAEGVRGEGPVVPEVPFDREGAIRALALLGPIFTKKALAAGRPNPRDTALVRVSGAVVAGVLNGGREAIRLAAESDSESRGYYRVITGTCEFCRGLASVGAAVGHFQAHSNCACVPEPAFGPAPQAPRTEAELKAFDLENPTDPDRVLRAMASPSRVSAERVLAKQGSNGQVSVLTTTGRRGSAQLLRKKYPDDDPYGLEDIQHQMDAEVLASRMGQRLGVETPRVAINGPFEVIQEFVDIPPDISGSLAAQNAAVGAQGADRLALLDWLTGQADRHSGNWLYDLGSDRVVAIDNAASWFRYGSDPDIFQRPYSPFVDAHMTFDLHARGFVKGVTSHPWSKAELLEFESQIRAMQPEFEAFGRLDWFQDTLSRLQMLQEAAT